MKRILYNVVKCFRFSPVGGDIYFVIEANMVGNAQELGLFTCKRMKWGKRTMLEYNMKMSCLKKDCVFGEMK